MKPSTPPLPDFSQAHVLVVGDVMLDRYWTGATARISPEAPVPVVRVEGTEVRPGGAANVALNVAALGASCTLVGVVGTDDAAAELNGSLAQGGVEVDLVALPEVTTITKLRVVSRHQQLIRLDFEAPITLEGGRVLSEVRTALSRHHHEVPLVILSDYGKGTLGADTPALVALGKDHGALVLVDPKHHDFSVYRGATLLTPNLAEFEAVVGVCASTAILEERAARLRAELDVNGLLVTCGDAGMSLFTADAALHLPAHAIEVYDVTGAGDTVIATLGAALAAGETLSDATRLANLAASVAVRKLGTATVSQRELRGASGGPALRGVVTKEQAVAEVAAEKALGSTVVMTNGCFDILHAGHVDGLRRAAALGDKLLVAVNDDASVARLKGPERPIPPLEDRMQVLAALESVDWVVPFSEDDPCALVEAISPDVLAKGGDYAPGEIAGADHVLRSGGRVEILPYVPGRSTTRVVQAIRGKEHGE